jgi:hypothetical protein
MGCKISVKFRVSEEKANIFVFLSGRNISKRMEKPYLLEFFLSAA